MKHFILDIARIKEFVAVNKDLAYSTIKPYLLQSQRKFIIPIIGSELFTLLVDYVNDEAAEVNELYDELIEVIQEALSNYALYLYAPIGQVMVSDSGIDRIETEEKKSAYQYQITALRTSWINAAHEAIDSLLELLDMTTREELSVWHDSAEKKASKGLFINSATVFTDYVANLKGSRRLFVHIKPAIRNIEKRYIPFVISQSLYNEIKLQLEDDSLSEANSALLDLIRPAVANFSFAKAITGLSLEVLPEGVFENFSSPFAGEKASNPVTPAKLHDYESQLMADGRADLESLKQFINENHADYPLFEESELFIETTSDDSQEGGLCIM